MTVRRARLLLAGLAGVLLLDLATWLTRQTLDATPEAEAAHWAWWDQHNPEEDTA